MANIQNIREACNSVARKQIAWFLNGKRNCIFVQKIHMDNVILMWFCPQYDGGVFNWWDLVDILEPIWIIHLEGVLGFFLGFTFGDLTFSSHMCSKHQHLSEHDAT